jgi:hypothetical protein
MAKGRPGPWPRDKHNGRFIPEKKGNGRVICTHLMQSGQLSRELWRADMLFTEKHLSPRTVRGYHFWAIPYVKLMRRSPLAERMILPLAGWRANEIAFQMGLRRRGDWRGKLVRLLGEPLCWLIGSLIGEQDWRSLYIQK